MKTTTRLLVLLVVGAAVCGCQRDPDNSQHLTMAAPLPRATAPNGASIDGGVGGKGGRAGLGPGGAAGGAGGAGVSGGRGGAGGAGGAGD